jgi:hypothetical protein
MSIGNAGRRALIASVATVFGFGLLGAGAVASGAVDDQYAKRDDDDARQVAVVDVDDDDDNTGTGNTANSGTGKSKDATNSRVTRVSRDNDRSRDDLTRDLTRDGNGKLKRDWSDNRTNDGTRNDSRASRHTNDATRSNYTAVSHDRDHSRADLTKDYTRDGGDRTRDFSRHLTNDRSRNDTR